MGKGHIPYGGGSRISSTGNNACKSYSGSLHPPQLYGF